jgi:hypothetical protein
LTFFFGVSFISVPVLLAFSKKQDYARSYVESKQKNGNQQSKVLFLANIKKQNVTTEEDLKGHI